MQKIKVWLALILIFISIPLSVWAADNPIQGADKIVIYAPDKSRALSSGKTGNYNQSVNVTLTDGVLSGYGDAETWTVEENADGSFRLLQVGQALSLGESYNYLRLDDVYDSWSIESTGDGNWKLKNVGQGVYLYLDTRRGHWSTSATGTALSFYIADRAEAPAQPDGWQFWFGQLHAHTDFSDGAGSVEEAFAHARDIAGLDFFAVTDHSQSFDNALLGELNTDGATVSAEWARGKEAAAAATDADFVGIFGFEMTWEQGQGHMATFRTPGFLSSGREEFESYADGMENYYAALLETENSVSMFCHPGDTYGDFKDFGSYSPPLDEKITLFESDFSGEAYHRALSLGWHLAPTAPGSNHGPLWGDETAARTVILAETLTEDSLYEAMASRRVYATADADLEILYTLNGSIMGSEIPRSQVGESVTIAAKLSDPTDDALGTVEVIGDGTSLTSCVLTTAQAEINLTLPANRDYYYLRITQPDGDVALTAPVWLDDQDDMGIAKLEAAGEVTSAGKPQTFLLELFNNENPPLEITSVTFTAEDSVYADTSVTQIASFESVTGSFTHTFPEDGVYTVTARVDAVFDGGARQFTKEIRVIVLPPVLVEDVILDGTHGNGEDFQPLLSLAAEQDVDIHYERNQITAQLLESCRLLIVPTPATDFEDSFLTAVKGFIQNGGSLILCGTSGERDGQAAERLNDLLDALGSTMSFQNNEVRDDILNRGKPAQLYSTAFADSPWLDGLTAGQRYGQELGCAIDPGSGQWLVTGEASAYCTDGAAPVLLAAEETGFGGSIFAAGSTFFASQHLSAERGWILPTANRTIMENLLGILRTPQDTIPIGQLRKSEPGRVYLTEGRVTAGTANPNTTFENTIYIQDGTGGIAATGYSDHGLPLGSRVRILGELTNPEGNPTLEILRLEILEKADVIAPEAALCSVSYAQRGGQLLALEGRVTALTADGESVSRFTLRDDTGEEIEVIIEDYILSGSLGRNELARTVEPGNRIRAVGLLHLSDGEAVLRIRDCDEVTCVTEDSAPDENPDTGDGIGLHILLLFLLPPAIVTLGKYIEK